MKVPVKRQRTAPEISNPRCIVLCFLRSILSASGIRVVSLMSMMRFLSRPRAWSICEDMLLLESDVRSLHALILVALFNTVMRVVPQNAVFQVNIQLNSRLAGCQWYSQFSIRNPVSSQLNGIIDNCINRGETGMEVKRVSTGNEYLWNERRLLSRLFWYCQNIFYLALLHSFFHPLKFHL